MRQLISLAAALALAALLAADEASGLHSPLAVMSCAKDLLVSLVKDKVISRSVMASSFNATMGRVRERYELAERVGKLEGRSEAEQQSVYYKIVAEEIRDLRLRIESGQFGAPKAEEPTAEDRMIESCVNLQANLDKLKQAPWNPDTVQEEEEELMLMEELDELERQITEEEEMGWSMSLEAQENLRLRTRAVVIELLNNELCQLAITVITSYLSGGSLTPPPHLMKAISSAIKFKLVEYFMNTVLDVISSIMGHRIEVSPLPAAAKPLLKTTTQSPALASASSSQPSIVSVIDPNIYGP